MILVTIAADFCRKLFWLMLNVLTPSFSTEETVTADRMSSRRRPLHTCGVAVLATTHRAYVRAQEFNGPSGSLFKSFTRLANRISPLVYAVLYQCLSMLSLADSTILVAEDVIERVIPSSSHVFDKIDELVQVTEALPEKIDNVINKVPGFIHQFPFLDRVLVHVILWFTQWESRTVREKEIPVDANWNECRDILACTTDANYPADSEPHLDSGKTGRFSPVAETGGNTRSTATGTHEKGSYKEVLEKGMREGGGGKKDSLEGKIKMTNVKTEDDGQIGEEPHEQVLEKGMTEEGGGGKRESLEGENEMMIDVVKTEHDGEIGEESYKEVLEKGMSDEGEGGKKDRSEGENKKINVKTEDDGQMGEEFAADPILELFESAWLKKPARREKGDST